MKLCGDVLPPMKESTPWENVMKASDSFAILLILVALSYAVSMFVAT
ncbi:hypothetical protein [Polynucleobacter sp. UK-Gri1-W3]|nr:hypothetical protein [Polynucleobacter sp. UK-Gri1-W3]MBU3539554.1 hypothetical protein [Polynucleobacter sp. UK-Gri1-W3]